MDSTSTLSVQPGTAVMQEWREDLTNLEKKGGVVVLFFPFCTVCLKKGWLLIFTFEYQAPLYSVWYSYGGLWSYKLGNQIGHTNGL